VAYITQVRLCHFISSYIQSIFWSYANLQANQELTKHTNELLSYTMGLLKKKLRGYFQDARSAQQIKPIGSRQVLLQLLVNDA
jgi:hypothetical protein